MIKVVIVVLSALVCFSCSELKQTQNLDIEAIIEQPSEYNDATLNIKGQFFTREDGSSILYQGDGVDYLDMVFDSKEAAKQIQDQGYNDQCVIASGVFMRYGNDFIGAGKLAGDYGLFKVSDIRPC